ncbi:alpha/beta hydrolase [Peteryoungia ipomoeae]|uniref:Alpha/beta hydrolase n=1 Tax=Peteryoungia ipomoeae TaxID=1210932 RepID=A0A4S8P4E9_9HYPH|nr:alpha/beta fold hydrolase [Peteryoungia ipomoeae]THV24940.1 alpha/beta hydrolase [Peteryoungia ipomoeae]
MPSLSLQVTRLFMRGLERVAPTLSGRVAFALFCRTPSRKPKGVKAVRAFAAGRRALASARRVQLPIASGTVGLHVLEANPEGAAPPRVLIVHGWGSRAEYLAELALNLNAAGAEVVILDLPGHGASSGRRLDLHVATEAIVAADRHFGGFDGVVGHSFGGASVMMALGGVFNGVARLRTRRVVVIGSPSNLNDVIVGFAKVVGVGERSLASMGERVFKLVGKRLEDLDAVTVAQQEQTPLLVVHAEDDKEVSPQHAHRYAGASPHVRHLWANGHGHRRIVSAAEVIEAVKTFLLTPEWSSNSAAGGRL